MSQPRANYLIVGGFVFASLAGLVIGLILLAGRSGATDTYYTQYENVAGLKFGTPVFFEGYLAGQVIAIEPDTNGGQTYFRVALDVSRELRIPDDSVALIVQPNLLSGRAVSIAAGRAETMVEPEGTIKGGSTTGLAALPDLVGSGRELIDEGRALMKESAAAMAKINNWLDNDAAYMAEQYRDLPASLRTEIGLVGDTVRTLIGDARAVMARASLLLSDDNINSVSRSIRNVEASTTEIAEISTKLTKMSDNVQAITVQLRDFVTDNKPDLEQTILDLQFSLAVVAERIDAITLNLEGTSQDMREFSRQLRMNPGLLLGGRPPTDEAALTDPR